VDILSGLGQNVSIWGFGRFDRGFYLEIMKRW